MTRHITVGIIARRKWRGRTSCPQNQNVKSLIIKDNNECGMSPDSKSSHDLWPDKLKNYTRILSNKNQFGNLICSTIILIKTFIEIKDSHQLVKKAQRESASGKINGNFPFTVRVHQKHGEKNHCKCDRCITLLKLIYLLLCLI